MGKKLLIVTSVVKFNPLAIVFIFNYKVLQLANMLEQVQFDDTSVYISIKKDLYSQACTQLIELRHGAATFYPFAMVKVALHILAKCNVIMAVALW